MDTEQVEVLIKEEIEIDSKFWADFNQSVFYLIRKMYFIRVHKVFCEARVPNIIYF